MIQLSELQQLELKEKCEYVAPESAECLRVFMSDDRWIYFNLNQDDLPVLIAYLKLVEEKMNE